jgi:hypothetical protein
VGKKAPIPVTVTESESIVIFEQGAELRLVAVNLICSVSFRRCADLFVLLALLASS